MQSMYLYTFIYIFLYWSNRKMIKMLYEYIIEYTKKHPATCFDEDINSTGKTWLSFNLSMVCQVEWPSGYGGGFTIQRS